MEHKQPSTPQKNRERIKTLLEASQTKTDPSKIIGLKELLIYIDLKQLHKIRHGKSKIKFDDFFSMSYQQKRTDKKLECKPYTRSFAQYTFGRRFQKYWNILPKTTRNLSFEKFKDEIKKIMTSSKGKRPRQKQDLLNLGLDTAVSLPPPGIYE